MGKRVIIYFISILLVLPSFSQPTTDSTVLKMETGNSGDQPVRTSGVAAALTANIKTVNGNSLIGEGDISISSAVDWGNVTGTLANQVDLTNALNGKAASSHSHTIGEVTGLQAALDGKADAVHSHTIGNITGLQAALDGKSDTDHTHEIAGVNGLAVALAGKAALSHNHAIADVTNLQTSLDAKAPIAAPAHTGAVTTTGSFGYTGAGTGGAVTQNANKSQGVTLNKICGQITMNNAALAAAAEVAFVVTNSTVASTDVVIANIQSVGTAGSYMISVAAVANGSFTIALSNVSTGSLSQALVINFLVLKSVAN